MREIALHLLDLAENSVSAGAKNVTIAVCEDLPADRLTASVKDDGRGMDQETLGRVTDPFYTSRTTRKVGLGIPLLKEAAEASQGRLEIVSQPGEGTAITAVFQHSHIDRMPLGDLASTLLNLLIAHPEIHWIFYYSRLLPGDGEPYRFDLDDAPLKEVLDGLSLTHPHVLTYLRETLEAGLQGVQA